MMKFELGAAMLMELFAMGMEIAELLSADGQHEVLTPEQIRAEKTRVFNERRIDEAIENRALRRAIAERESRDNPEDRR